MKNLDKKDAVSPSTAMNCSTAREGNAERETANHTHAWVHLYDEYGSLASGGSYERLKCQNCGEEIWSELPD